MALRQISPKASLQPCQLSRIRDIGLLSTMLRRTSFFELYFSPYVAYQSDVLLFLPDPETTVQHIAVEDIGVFARWYSIGPKPSSAKRWRSGAIA